MTETRICIKGLPPDVDEPALRERFSERGEVTDAKVIRTRCIRRLLLSPSPSPTPSTPWVFPPRPSGHSLVCCHLVRCPKVTNIRRCRRDGRSRQFGFVGYTSAAEAQDAIKYFNKSFIGTFRLVVEVCVAVTVDHYPAVLLAHVSSRAALGLVSQA